MSTTSKTLEPFATRWVGENYNSPWPIALYGDVRPERAADFPAAMREFGRIRRRDGASHWGICRDLETPGRYLETFIVGSWDEHLRQHERATVGDRTVQERIRRFHIADAPPSVTHLIAAKFTRP